MTRDSLAIFVICVLYLATLYGAGRYHEKALTESYAYELERVTRDLEACLASHDLRNSYLAPMAEGDR